MSNGYKPAPRKGGNAPQVTGELPRYRVHSTCYIADSLCEVDSEVQLDDDYPASWYLEPVNDAARKINPNWKGYQPMYIPPQDDLNRMAQAAKLEELKQMIVPN